MPRFRDAYAQGASVSFETFAVDPDLLQRKLGYDSSSNDRLIAALGAVGPAAAGVGAGMTAPDGYALGTAARTGLGATGGQYAGEAGGELLGRVLAGLLKQNPNTFGDVGSRVGKHVGGAVGADVGNTWAKQHTMQDMYKQRLSGNG